MAWHLSDAVLNISRKIIYSESYYDSKYFLRRKKITHHVEQLQAHHEEALDEIRQTVRRGRWRGVGIRWRWGQRRGLP